MAGQGGIRAGKAFVELYTKDSELVKGLRRAQRKISVFGSQITRIGAMTAGAGAGILAAFIPAIKSASDLQEIMGKFNVVFGENSKAMKEWGDNFANEVGRSKKQVAEFLAGSQDLFVPLGFEPGAAEELSKQITGLAVDLGSFHNKVDADVMRDLQAALTGSGETMKKYGAIVSEAAVKQELLNMGMDPKTADNQAKVQARLNIIMAATTAAQGDAIRTSESFANQMKRLWAVFEDTKDEIGNAFLPMLTEYLKKANEIIPKIGEWISLNKETVKDVAILTAKVAGAGVALMALGKVIQGVATAMKLLNVAIAAGPVGLAALGVAIGTVGLVGFIARLNLATNAARRLREELQQEIRDDKFEQSLKIKFEDDNQRKKFLEQKQKEAEESIVKHRDIIDNEAKKEKDKGAFQKVGDAIFDGGFDPAKTEKEIRLQKQRLEIIRTELELMEAQKEISDATTIKPGVAANTGIGQAAGSNIFADAVREASAAIRNGAMTSVADQVTAVAGAGSEMFAGPRIKAMSQGGTFSGNTSQFAGSFTGNKPEDKVSADGKLLGGKLDKVIGELGNLGILGRAISNDSRQCRRLIRSTVSFAHGSRRLETVTLKRVLKSLIDFGTVKISARRTGSGFAEHSRCCSW